MAYSQRPLYVSTSYKACKKGAESASSGPLVTRTIRGLTLGVQNAKNELRKQTVTGLARLQKTYKQKFSAAIATILPKRFTWVPTHGHSSEFLQLIAR